jgi:5-deoxy-D-glucuronate isomerase
MKARTVAACDHDSWRNIAISLATPKSPSLVSWRVVGHAENAVDSRGATDQTRLVANICRHGAGRINGALGNHYDLARHPPRRNGFG